MPRSRTNPQRAANARRYGRKDARYRRVLGWWEADRALCPEAHPQRNAPGRAWFPSFFPTAFLLFRAKSGPKNRVLYHPRH